MSTIVTRAGKGSPLTNTEVDSNFTNLNTDKLEKDGSNLASKISFDTTAGLTPTTGELVWDAETGTVDIGLNGASAPVFSVGEDQFYRVINQTGSTIAKGALVMAFGTVGASGVIKVKPWDGTQPSKTIMGLALAAIPTEDDPTESGLGYILAFGKLRGIQTNGGNYSESWVDGDIIYAGASGGLTKTMPAAPNTKTTVAIVINSHPSNGTLFVRPTYGSSLGEDELVQLASLAGGDVLSYDATDGRFENKTLAAAGIYASSNPAGYTTNTGTVTSVVGTGTVNGISLSGTVTSSGNLTLGGTLSGVNLTTQVTGTLPVANGGTGQTTYTNGQLLIGNTTGSTLTKATLTAGTGVSITNGSGAITIAATNNGTVTSVGGTGTVNGISLSGTVTSSGSLTLGGTLSGVNLASQVTGTLPVANGGTGITSFGTGVATALGQNVTGSGGIALATTPTLSGPTFNDGYTEEVFAVTGTTPDLSPTNGSIQTWTLSGASTPAPGTWAAGQSITLMIDDGSAATVTWGWLAVTWKTDGGSAPTLNTTGYTVIQLWKVGTTIYGARVGDA